MLGQRIPFVLAILSLLIIDIYGLTSKEDTWRCPKGTPLSRGCNPRTFPSTCPNGYHCYSPTDGPGLCCPGSAKVTCPSGGSPAGPCRPFGTDQCPSGHFCALGTCCPNDLFDIQNPPPNCQDGGIPSGRCVPSVSNQCAGGFFCQDVPGERTGVCCPTRIVQTQPGSCPVVNNVGPCVILPNNCGSDDECRQGQRCCPDGCGKVCKYVGGGSYILGL